MVQNELENEDGTPCDGRKKEEVSGAALMARDFLAKRDEVPRVRRGGEGKSRKKEQSSEQDTSVIFSTRFFLMKLKKYLAAS